MCNALAELAPTPVSSFLIPCMCDWPPLTSALTVWLLMCYKLGYFFRRLSSQLLVPGPKTVTNRGVTVMSHGVTVTNRGVTVSVTSRGVTVTVTENVTVIVIVIVTVIVIEMSHGVSDCVSAVLGTEARNAM